MTSLGVRLNNPGNLEQGQPWKGLSKEQKHSRFCTFDTPEYGIRAMARIIIGYAERYQLTTLDQVIAKYAPKGENDVSSYVRFVQSASGIDRGSYTNFADKDVLLRLLPAMVRMEQGVQPYSIEQFHSAIDAALKG